MINIKTRWLAAIMLVATALSSFGSVPTQPAQAQLAHYFPETGHTVSGRFLDYWTAHGGLAQQGYPISEEMSEVSATNGKTYTVQYFERAVFEKHPENAAPNDVLLSLLGVFLYNQKYPAGAPGQLPNSEADAYLFPETGHAVGGLFLIYWNTHGGLAQQGYPISDEFAETSALNGQIYKVQYFERAVFEYHHENPAPYNVLLSQLGTFRLRDKLSASPTSTPILLAPTSTPVPLAPTSTPVPLPPTQSPLPACDPSGSINGRATPDVAQPGQTIEFFAWGFGYLPSGRQGNEQVIYWFTRPDGTMLGDAQHARLAGVSDYSHNIGPLPFGVPPSYAQYPGKWAITLEGRSTHHQAIIYFCVVP